MRQKRKLPVGLFHGFFVCYNGVMSEDQFMKLVQYMEKRFDEVNERFDKQDKRFDDLTNLIDGYASRLDTYA